MAKTQAVINDYNRQGKALSGDAYNKDMRKAEQQDQAASHSQAPAPRNAEIAAQHEEFIKKCVGCCNTSEEGDPDYNSSCCIIM